MSPPDTQPPEDEKAQKYVTSGAIYSSPAVAADGTVYIGSVNGRLLAIDPDGNLVWMVPVSGWFNESPALCADGTIVFGTWGNRVHAVNPDGSEKWLFATEGTIVAHHKRSCAITQ